ncbi:MAG: hypothetical protein O9283_05940 [Sphingomonadaceae bacterium]|nr:hypothetical protein [Sphingomonadaceae bacterium]
MRQLVMPVATGFLALMLAGCTPDRPDKAEQPEAKQPTFVEAAEATADAAASAAASETPSPAASARALSERTRAFEFEYAYPAAAAAIPDLVVELEADLARQRRELARIAPRPEAGERPIPYAKSVQWDVVTELPGWLSLSAAVYADTGGAHPNRWSQALLWDKAAGKSRKATDLFVSGAALAEAIRQPFCRALNRERAARRGEVVRGDSGEMFDECIDPTRSTVILGSSNRQQFDRIGVLIAPYEAGSYAEGDYEITLPVTRAVLAVVKPQYRAVFAPGR